jgi:hypothetical protein
VQAAAVQAAAVQESRERAVEWILSWSDETRP